MTLWKQQWHRHSGLFSKAWFHVCSSVSWDQSGCCRSRGWLTGFSQGNRGVGGCSNISKEKVPSQFLASEQEFSRYKDTGLGREIIVFVGQVTYMLTSISA